ncbi:MAG: hypothetical protein RIB79_00930 [Allomuricauda sp.]
MTAPRIWLKLRYFEEFAEVSSIPFTINKAGVCAPALIENKINRI